MHNMQYYAFLAQHIVNNNRVVFILFRRFGLEICPIFSILSKVLIYEHLVLFYFYKLVVTLGFKSDLMSIN